MSTEPEVTQRGRCQQQEITQGHNSTLPGDGGMGNQRTDDVTGWSARDAHNVLAWCSGGGTGAAGATGTLTGDATQRDGPVDMRLPAAAGSPHQALLGRGVPSHSVPKVEIISLQMRADILQGKDINLAALLMQGYDPEPELSQRTTHVPGGEAVSIRPRSSQSKDPRLSKNLTLPEFIKAFNIYSNVMCQGYPHRKGELDAYLTEIIGMATDFGAGTFYEYHKMFSARAATLLLNHNVKLDWSVRDNDMYCKLFAGRRAIACGICSSMAHSTDFCPLSTGFRNNRRLGGTGHFNKSENGVAQRGKGDGICHAFNSTKAVSGWRVGLRMRAWCVDQLSTGGPTVRDLTQAPRLPVLALRPRHKLRRKWRNTTQPGTTPAIIAKRNLSILVISDFPISMNQRFQLIS